MKQKLRVIDKSMKPKGTINSYRIPAVSRRSKTITLQFGVYDEKDCVNEVYRFRVLPEMILSLAVDLVRRAEDFEKATGKRILPEDYPRGDADQQTAEDK